jgi:DNA-binding HxlR family transcriptional regulator
MSMQIDAALPAFGDWRTDDCPLDRASLLLGSRAALLIVREAFYGTVRFSEFVNHTRLTDAVVSGRLRALTDAGVFEKKPYREPKRRGRFEYILTPMGEDLLPLVVSLLQWGGKYLQRGHGPVALVTGRAHSGVSVDVQSGRSNKVLTAAQLTVVPRVN